MTRVATLLFASVLAYCTDAAALNFKSMPRGKANFKPIVRDKAKPPPAIAAAGIAAILLCCSSPTAALAQEQQSAPVQPLPAAEVSRAYFDPKDGGQGISAVVATPAELKELKSGAANLELPNVSAESDLGRLLAGGGGGSRPGTSADPRAHN